MVNCESEPRSEGQTKTPRKNRTSRGAAAREVYQKYKWVSEFRTGEDLASPKYAVECTRRMHAVCSRAINFVSFALGAPSHWVHAIHATTSGRWIAIAVVVVHVRTTRVRRWLCYCGIHTLRVL